MTRYPPGPGSRFPLDQANLVKDVLVTHHGRFTGLAFEAGKRIARRWRPVLPAGRTPALDPERQTRPSDRLRMRLVRRAPAPEPARERASLGA